jgi:hypothetical protein
MNKADREDAKVAKRYGRIERRNADRARAMAEAAALPRHHDDLPLQPCRVEGAWKAGGVLGFPSKIIPGGGYGE